MKNAGLIAATVALLDGRTVTWSKVKSHTTLTTREHQLNREADERAAAVVAAVTAGRAPHGARLAGLVPVRRRSRRRRGDLARPVAVLLGGGSARHRLPPTCADHPADQTASPADTSDTDPSEEPVSTITVDGSTLTVRLSAVEKALGLLRDQVVPRSAVVDVEVVEDGLSAVRGIRAPGLGVPVLRKLGTWRGAGRTRFVDVRRGEPALRVTLRGHRYDELLLGTPDAAELAASLRVA